MKKDPLELAIRKISETRNLLQLLITSSEGFDYPQAKSAIRDLQSKVQELAHLQQDLKRRCVPAADVIEFPVLQED